MMKPETPYFLRAPWGRSLIGALLFVFLVAACEDGETVYAFTGAVTEKFMNESSSEPLRVVFEVKLNEDKPKRIECRIKNKLKPMWDGLFVGAKVKMQKISSHKYSAGTFCGLLNDANVKDVLDQLG